MEITDPRDFFPAGLRLMNPQALALNLSFSILQSTGSPVSAYHLQRALPGGIILMELAFQVSGGNTEWGESDPLTS